MHTSFFSQKTTTTTNKQANKQTNKQTSKNKNKTKNKTKQKHLDKFGHVRVGVAVTPTWRSLFEHWCKEMINVLFSMSPLNTNLIGCHGMNSMTLNRISDMNNGRFQIFTTFLQ